MTDDLEYFFTCDGVDGALYGSVVRWKATGELDWGLVYDRSCIYGGLVLSPDEKFLVAAFTDTTDITGTTDSVAQIGSDSGVVVFQYWVGTLIEVESLDVSPDSKFIAIAGRVFTIGTGPSMVLW